MNKKATFLCIGFVVIGLTVWFVSPSCFSSPDNGSTNNDPVNVNIGTASITAEIADTPGKSELGLGQRDKLDENAGMVFIIKPARQTTFWMKGMRFPLDIIWVSENRITGIERNVQPPQPPGDYPRTVVTSPSSASYVIEVNAGWTEKNSVKVGDTVMFCQ